VDSKYNGRPPVDLLAGGMSDGGDDRRHPADYGPDVWPLSASAVCYEPGCVLSMPTNATDQFRPADDPPTTSTSFWLGRPSFSNDNALFRSSRELPDRHFYSQRQTIPAVSLHPLSSAVQPPQSTGTYCNCSHLGQHTCSDRFSSNNCEYLELQPFQQGGSGYPWLPSAGDGYVDMPQQVPLDPRVGLSSCPPGGLYAPGLEVGYSPPSWLHVKSERRSSSSAASSSFDGPPAAGCATKIVSTSPSFYNSRQLKQEKFVLERTVERSYDEFGISAGVGKDERIDGRGQSDTSPSSVEQLSDTVCHPVCVLRCNFINVCVIIHGGPKVSRVPCF